MSVKWMSHIWETDLEGTEKLLALAIADHADDDGECFPGLERLAAKMCLKKRRTQQLLQVLETKGIIKVNRRQGRGLRSTIQILKKVKRIAPIRTEEKVQSEDLKGAIQSQEKVQSRVCIYKDEPSLEPSRTVEPERGRIFIPINPDSEDKLLSWLDAVAVAVGAGARKGLADYPRWEKACIKAIESGLVRDDFARVVQREYSINARYMTPEKSVQIAQTERQLTVKPKTKTARDFAREELARQ